MKTVEEKAKAYDKVREKIAVRFGTNVAEEIFSEFEESEDERIRQKFIKLVKMSSEVGGFALHKWEADEMLAWLEEQGKQKSIINVPTRDVILSIWDLGNEWKELTNGSISTEYGTQLDYIQNHWQESEYYLRAKQGEQKPSDKVEPKFKLFKPGDWITNGACTIQITSVNDIFYFHDNDCIGGDIESIDKKYHLWTINDAKPGDILIDSWKELKYPIIFILKDFKNVDHGLYKPSDYHSFCYLKANDTHIFCVEGWHHKNNIQPATKEQRDLLFHKMREAGYEWDAEKKELKKIEQKPIMIQWQGNNLKEVIDFTGKDKNFEKWFKSFEEYEKYVDDHNGIFKLFNADGSHYEVPIGSWIVKTPDGYNVASKAFFRQKNAWSEEDTFKVQRICKYLDEVKKYYADITEVRECMDWLKSLRPQPKQERIEED